MTRHRDLARVACALLLGVSLLAADGRQVFGVGILRQDGIIIPFGAFDGQRWSNSWPSPQGDLTVPISVRDVPSAWWGPTPPLANWQAWTRAGPQPVGIGQLDWVDAHCVRQIGFRTDFRPPLPPPPRGRPYPKEGLAVSPPQPVEPIEMVTTAGEEARLLTPALRESFNAAERAVADRRGHPVSRQGRESVAPDIEAIHAVGDNPRFYHVEATRRYRQSGQRADQCAVTAFSSGWFVRDGSDVRSLDLELDLLPCDLTGAGRMSSFGAIRLAHKLFWLAQLSGSDSERYVVVELAPSTARVVLSVWGGSCQGQVEKTKPPQ
jgi:hypothetical protein